jgi:LuxR family maltose regulon positive regulatory protein
MASPLVDTKLYVPQLRRSLVARPRLSERLDRGAEAKLTLVSAPAGFGKTTSLAAWLAQTAEPRSVAWLSLEESDSQPVSFWTYVVTALHSVAPGVGASVLPLLRSGQPATESVLTTVLNELNELSARSGGLALVLDDYHLADGPEVAAAMAFFLEHLPTHIHLIISTRADPDLPLARLRARGDLVEVRASDLRFTLDEAAAYLNEAAGLDLTAGAIAALEGRTEGWIAALQLASLSMQGRADVAGFIATFAGDDRYIVDYLVEEVLTRQPEHIRTFLLQTSILDRLSGPLCDAVSARAGSKTMLEGLDRANLFLVPLDDHRRWYRYHHLFADVLQTHLRDERPDDIAELHRRASEWYDQAGEPSPAVRHALASGDADRAATLVERAIPALQRDRQEATIRGWLDDIPDDVVRRRPMLAIGFVGALMSSNEFVQVEPRLRDVEQWLATARARAHAHAEPDPQQPALGTVVDDDVELAHLPGMVELYRAGLALVQGEMSATVQHAQQAIDRAAPEDHVVRAGAAALAGLAYWNTGDLEAAHRGYSTCVDGLLRAGHFSDVLGCSITLADLRITQGRLGDALTTYERALQLASQHCSDVLRGTADMHVGISQVALARGDLHSAKQHVQLSQELGERLGLPQFPYRWRAAMATLREAEGDLIGARDLLEDAQRVHNTDFSPNARPLPALKARVLVAQGDLDGALRWAAEQGLSATDDLSYLRECEHITLARVLLAEHTTRRSVLALHDAEVLLERLLAAAEQGGRTGSVLEVLVLQALTRHARRDVAGAAAPLKRALSLGEAEGYVWVFAREGSPMASLLEIVVKQRRPWAYGEQLLDACARHDLAAPTDQASLEGRAAPPSRGLVDPLSARELEVLRLLASNLDGPGIARHLVVSLNTLRTHTKNIYAKLGVNSRRAALRRAQELDLLSDPRGR